MDAPTYAAWTREGVGNGEIRNDEVPLGKAEIAKGEKPMEVDPKNGATVILGNGTSDLPTQDVATIDAAPVPAKTTNDSQ
jgi:hypothetical protein